jgi:AcrR family transcriptional regulator
LHGEVIQLKLDKKVVAQTDWPDALVPVTEQVSAAGRKLAQALSELETCRITIFEKAAELGDDERASLEAALGHVAEVYEAALARAERGIERERVTFDKTLGAFAS